MVLEAHWSIKIDGRGQIRPHDDKAIEELLIDFIGVLKDKGQTFGSARLNLDTVIEEPPEA